MTDVLISVDRDPAAPWFPLGSDALGRDQLARLAVGARLSLGVALVAAFGALLARRGHRQRRRLSGRLARRPADARVRLHPRASRGLRGPRVACRHAAGLELPSRSSGRWSSCWRPWDGRSPREACAPSWPASVIGIRRSCAGDRGQSYAVIATSPVPAARGFLVVQTTLLGARLRAGGSHAVLRRTRVLRVVSELGRDVRDAGQGRAFVEAPWLFAPALAIVLSALAINLAAAESGGRTRPLSWR